MKRKARTMGSILSTDSTVSPTTSSAAIQSSGLAFPLPVDILEEIFLHLPPHQVVCVSRLVCHQWKEVADSDSFWRERCRREGYDLCSASKIPDDWRLFYFLCKNKRNLIRNPRGEDKMNGWKIMENGGDQWKVHSIRVPHPNEAIKTDFVTSYGMCRKSQLIDLVKEGYSPSFMDDFRPHIRISDWYAPRHDCGSEYTIFVRLLNQKKKVVDEFTPDTVYFPQWSKEEWHQITHIFKDYGPGVRYIHFIHGGKDTQFWAGWYGIHLTESCVEVCPAVDA